MSTNVPNASARQASANQAPATQKPVAVFVCHGMGQQVHFETIEGVANALLKEQGSRTQPRRALLARFLGRPPRAQQTSKAELAKLGEHILVRGSLTLGAGREVHIYEGYWAPLTEGKIGVWKVFGFLLGSARLGIWNCLRKRGFIRFMFHGTQVFGGLHLLGLAMLAVLTYFILALLVGPVMLANAVTFASLISLLFTKNPAMWASSPLVKAGTWYVARIEMFIFVLGFAVVVLPRLYSWLRRKILLLQILGWMIRLACFYFAFQSLAGVGLTAWSAVANFASYATQNLTGASPDASRLIQPLLLKPRPQFLYVWLSAAFQWFASWTYVPYGYLRLAIIWALALVFGYFVRWFLVEYVGDVAIYTSSYKVSEFDEIRDKIRATVFAAARPIYTARTGPANTGPFVYDQVYVLGHSLGSVIAYDTLNSLLVEDRLGTNSVDIAGRTKLLLTFGSPLDKVAFIFRTHSSSTHDFREKAAEQLQPLIKDYDNRPNHWVNIWSPMDIISGRLKYYDDTNKGTGGSKRVDNRWDLQAWVPFAAHTEYWQNTLFAKTLYDAVVAP